MKNVRYVIFIVAIGCIALVAQANENIHLFHPATQQIVLHNTAIQIPGAQYATIDSAAFSTLLEQQEAQLGNFPLPGGLSVTLSLQAFSVFTPAAKFVATTANGAVSVPPPNVSLFRGTVSGDALSSVYLALYGNKVSGYVKTGGNDYAIGMVEADVPSGVVCQIYDTRSVPDGVFQINCANSDFKSPAPAGIKSKSQGSINSLNIPAPPKIASSANYLVKLAIDVDYEGYVFWNNDVTTAENYVTQMFGAINTVYQTEANVDLKINYLNVWTTSSEPYTVSPGGGTGFNESAIEGALNQVAQYWSQNMDTVDRAAMMLITKKPMCGSNQFSACGLGTVDTYNSLTGTQLGVLCDNNNAYSVTAVSGNSQFIIEDEKVAAHELGHNFGCLHTHNCFWVDSGITSTPIDECVAPDADPFTGNTSCYTGTIQSQGTIMSYCNSTDFSFGTVVGSWLKGHVADNAGSNWTCVVPEALSAATSVINFGANSVGKEYDSSFANFLTNFSTKSVSVSSCKISGPNANCFTLKSQNSFQVGPGGRYTLKLAFTPDSNGVRSAILTIANNSSVPSIVIALSGIGGTAQLSFNGSDTLTWLSVAPGDTNNVQELDITDTSNIAITINSTKITGADSALFKITSGAAPFTLSTDGTPHVMFINYYPTIAGTNDATLNINGTAGAYQIPLIGNSTTSVVPENATAFPSFLLNQNYPNPVLINSGSSITTFQYRLAHSSNITLAVYDIFGRLVAQLFSGVAGEGNHIVQFDADKLQSGTYFYKLQTPGTSLVRMMMVIR